ncbi:hypothetical protein CYMTET_38883 [Cymbomonas tetramitiformis]|uniref:Uncharacterized protein n=1 Tax=Cymbomonas tetramitiformis TaxID=36881 RepID=A0AAE0CCJ1_9CHLO|nr:hypothetical protein CYMTET_38883 [Cymbomonas tetramitiformis]
MARKYFEDALPFEDARAIVRALGLRTQADWLRWSASGARPNNIPGCPHMAPPRGYGGIGWKGLRDWLGMESQEHNSALAIRNDSEVTRNLATVSETASPPHSSAIAICEDSEIANHLATRREKERLRKQKQREAKKRKAVCERPSEMAAPMATTLTPHITEPPSPAIAPTPSTGATPNNATHESLGSTATGKHAKGRLERAAAGDERAEHALVIRRDNQQALRDRRKRAHEDEVELEACMASSNTVRTLSYESVSNSCRRSTRTKPMKITGQDVPDVPERTAREQVRALAMDIAKKGKNSPTKMGNLLEGVLKHPLIAPAKVMMLPYLEKCINPK